jgi:hypothetical protein
MLTSTSTSIEKRSRSDRHASFPLGFGGWTLDPFDCFLVISCLTDIGHQFHGPDMTVTRAIPMPETVSYLTARSDHIPGGTGLERDEGVGAQPDFLVPLGGGRKQWRILGAVSGQGFRVGGCYEDP